MSIECVPWGQAQYSCTARCWELSKELRANKEYSRGIVKPNGTKQNFIMSSFYCFFFLMFIFESPLHSEPAVARKATKCARLTDTDRAPQPIFSLGGGHSAGASWLRNLAILLSISGRGLCTEPVLGRRRRGGSSLPLKFVFPAVWGRWWRRIWCVAPVSWRWRYQSYSGSVRTDVARPSLRHRRYPSPAAHHSRPSFRL